MTQSEPIPYGYCRCGCGEKTRIADRNRRARQQVLGEPLRYIPGHQWRKGGPLYELDPHTGCLIWQGTINKQGYGRGPSTRNLAHRDAWERVHGPISPKLQIHHKCGRKACCNASHMELLTTADHARLHFKLPPPPRKLSDAQVQEICVRSAAGESKLALAEEFGVSRSLVTVLVRTGGKRLSELRT